VIPVRRGILGLDLERVTVSEPSAVLVLGAGLTGISASHALRRAGVPHRIVDSAPAMGGHAVTTEEQGYRFDRTGHLLHLRDDKLRSEILSWFGPGRVVEVKRKSAVYSHGVYTRYPFQANTFGLPKEVSFACVSGFVRAHFAEPGPAPKTFAEFAMRHFGPGICEHFMIPYNEKLWGVPATEISADWCQRFVPIPTLDDVLGGAIGLNDRELGYNTQFLYPRLGIGELVALLAERANAIELSTTPRRIGAKDRSISWGDGDTHYDRIISSIPLPALIALISDAPDEVRVAASRLRATHLYYLDVALNTPCEKPFHWIYVPESRFPFYRVGCYSHFSAAMAPPQKASLYVELATREAPELSAILPEVALQLVEMGIIRSVEAVRFARLRRIDPAYVIYDAHHAEATRLIHAWLSEQNIVSTGRYGAWNYSSMEDAIVMGRDAAASVIRALGGALSS
jgi:protoporphyrinogen oxidase